MASSYDNDDVIICRCEEVKRREILEAIQMGCRTVDEVKKMTRAGMGPCQGRTCGRLIAKIISEQTGLELDEVSMSSVRFPVQSLPFSAIAASKNVNTQVIQNQTDERSY
jgi:NAD(P)H-nitrite reductase large subunit